MGECEWIMVMMKSRALRMVEGVVEEGSKAEGDVG